MLFYSNIWTFVPKPNKTSKYYEKSEYSISPKIHFINKSVYIQLLLCLPKKQRTRQCDLSGLCISVCVFISQRGIISDDIIIF